MLFRSKPAENGEGELRFKAPATGQYRLSISLTDEKGNKEEGASVFVVRRVDDDGSGSRFNPLELVLDKKDYKSGEEAKLLVNTNKEGSTVLLFLRSNGRSAEELRTITIEGKSKEVVIKLRKGDMPNIFVQAVTLSDGEVVTQTMQIVLPPEKRLLSVEVEPGKSKYKPREKGILKLRLKDENGEPYQGTTVVTVYDKSLEYISGGSNVGNIREFFWSWKRSFSNDGLVHSQNWSGRNLNELRAIARQTLRVSDIEGIPSPARKWHENVYPELKEQGESYEEIQISYQEAVRPMIYRCYYRAYKTLDGGLTLGTLAVHARARLLDVFGLEDPRVTDPEYDDSTPEATELGLRLTRQFEEIFAGKTTDYWFKELRAHDIPCEPVRFVEEMITDEQVLANNYVIELEHHTGHKIRTSGPVLQFADGMPEARSSPALGAHTDEVLADIGYSPGEVAGLRRDGSVN